MLLRDRMGGNRGRPACLDTLTAALVVRQLRPWHENLAKRQVKAPKVFISDTGLLHALPGEAHGG